MPSDKYPPESNRRRFVKGVVGGAALSAGGGASVAAVDSLTVQSGVGGGTTEFYGVENVRGPAPRAMPQIPVEIDDQGFLRGIYPDGGEMAFDSVDVTYEPEWFQYCGVQTYPGVQPGGARDDYFRYAKIESGDVPGLEWMIESDAVTAGDRVNVDQFSDYENWGNDVGEDGLGKPARVTWRSEGAASEETMVVEIVRSTEVETMADRNDWIAESTSQGFIAYLDKCTHFCCIPSFKGLPGSKKFDAEDGIYCPCHQSVYDPFSIVRRTFVALPRPETGGGRG